MILISLHSSTQTGVAGKEKNVKEHAEVGSNKRNARKKKNRNVCLEV